MKYGHFDDEKREYVIINPKTPYPWINYLGNEDFFSKQFSIYPNPTSENFLIEMPTNVSSADISIFDYLGRLVSNQTISSSSTSINVSGLNSGTYVVYVATEEGVAKKRLVVK